MNQSIIQWPVFTSPTTDQDFAREMHLHAHTASYRSHYLLLSYYSNTNQFFVIQNSPTLTLPAYNLIFS